MSTVSNNELPPVVELTHLDHLWFQVSGTLCNLTCHHCFISCSPKNDTFGYLTLEEVKRRLEESATLGVKEYYFTGGEPFLNPEMVPIVVETLRYGPATVLTNGTVLKDPWLSVLREAEMASPYSLEFRVSIDGFSPETNDPIRGEGTFQRAIRGIQKLVEIGFLPIITATRTWPEAEDQQIVSQFVDTLKSIGYERPRLKILPPLQIGAEAERTHSYRDSERVTRRMMQGFDASQLVCEHSRIVTDRGVYVCPILIEADDANLGDTLTLSTKPYALNHGACYTCYQYGAICSNAPSTVRTAPSKTHDANFELLK
ncbi:MAG: radical SAM protein [Planctomycetes bacterium]|nr:radical SAM protein [Planctomycetota bacterium]